MEAVENSDLYFIGFLVTFCFLAMYTILRFDATCKDIRIKIYVHTLSWNILPCLSFDWHGDTGRGWMLTFGWLCCTIELDYEFRPF